MGAVTLLPASRRANGWYETLEPPPPAAPAGYAAEAAAAQVPAVIPSANVEQGSKDGAATT